MLSGHVSPEALSETTTRDVLKKKLFLKILQYLKETPVLEFLFNRLQHRCFHVNFAKFLRTPILNNICE